MEEWLTERRGARVEVRNPQRGELTKLRRMADANAEAQLMRNQLRQSGNLEQRAAIDGARLLDMENWTILSASIWLSCKEKSV
ncbi:MAG: hypothetical protein CM1200mP21_01970 [Candidatus Poseidoniales archaeon]|nr:MAG: hypothetical protein CM1200mP21_01970 [Candidatus Poseidoniales archaeon]